MKIQKYLDIGADLAEDLSSRETNELTYPSSYTVENTEYGPLIKSEGTAYNIKTGVKPSYITGSAVFTISFRAKRDSKTASNDSIALALGGSGGWNIYFNTADYLYAAAYTNVSDQVFLGGLPLSSVDSTEWNTYSIVGNGSNVLLYVNAVYVGILSAVTPANFDDSFAYEVQLLSSIPAAMNGFVTSFVLDSREWSTDEITAFHNNSTFDYEKDIHANWKFNTKTDVIDSSFKAINEDSNAGFDCTKVGEFKKYPYFTGASNQYFTVPVNFTGYASVTIEFDCIIDSSDTQGQLIARTNTTCIQFWDGNVNAIGTNLGAGSIVTYIDGVQIADTNDALHDAIADGTVHHVKFENVKCDVYFTSSNYMSIMSNPAATSATQYTKGYIYNFSIDLTGDGNIDYFWPLDEANGLSPTIGTGDLTAVGSPTWTSTSIESLKEGYNDRVSDKALTFSGSEYMTLDAAAATSLNGLDAVTFICWVKNVSGGTILGLWNDSEEKLHIDINSDGTLSAKITTTDGNGTTVLTSNIKINDTEWHHIAIVIDLGNDECTFYIDGTQDSNGAQTIGRDSTFVSGGVTSYLASDGFSNSFIGSLSELRIYAIALNYSDIRLSAKKALNNIPVYFALPFNIDINSIATGNNISIESIQGVSNGGVPFVSDDGRYIYGGDVGTDQLHQYTMSTPWDISTLTHTYSTSTGAWGNNYCTSMYMSPDGTRMISTSSGANLHYYSLSTPYDASTITKLGTITTTTINAALTDVWYAGMSYDGTKLYIPQRNTNDVYQCSLTTPYDPTTWSYDGMATLSTLNVNGSLYVSQDKSTYIAYYPNGATVAMTLTVPNSLIDGMTQTQIDSTTPVLTNKVFTIGENGNRAYYIYWNSGDLRIMECTYNSL